jgi:hypothetical protein
MVTILLSIVSNLTFAKDMADQIREHGGLYTSVTTYTELGPVMVIKITYYCNDRTSLSVSDWYWD